jgi:5'-nucleotidase
MSKDSSPIILVDMDGVLADFDRGFISKWKLKYPDIPYIPVEERTTFYSSRQYPEEHQPKVWKIMQQPGFFIDLPPIEGGIDTVKQIAASGFEVFFCSSPLISNPSGASDKYEWINKHFGKKWVGKLILAPDKTLVDGHILIDDRPEIKGVRTPTWEHVLYDQPFNREITDRRRLTWATWQDILLADK